MSETLKKLCPFCNKPFVLRKVVDITVFSHDSPGCPLNEQEKQVIALDIQAMIRMLDTRPIEDALNQRIKELESGLVDGMGQVSGVIKIIEFHPRAAKLMRKRKNFLVVAEDEPYFEEVYNKIRNEEQRRGRWTDEDEYHYEVATGKWQP